MSGLLKIQKQHAWHFVLEGVVYAQSIVVGKG